MPGVGGYKANFRFVRCRTLCLTGEGFGDLRGVGVVSGEEAWLAEVLWGFEKGSLVPSHVFTQSFGVHA